MLLNSSTANYAALMVTAHHVIGVIDYALLAYPLLNNRSVCSTRVGAYEIYLDFIC